MTDDPKRSKYPICEVSDPNNCKRYGCWKFDPDTSILGCLDP